MVVWVAATTGIVLKTVFFESVPPWLGVVIYVGFGWFGLVSATRLLRSFGARFVAPLFYGALAYTGGAGMLGLLFSLGDPMLIPGVVGRHEIFHLAVLTGIAFHWQFVYRIADGTCCCEDPAH